MADQFYKVKIGDYFLSEDGTDTPELLCRLDVTNVEDLKASVIGVSIPAIGGTVRQTVPWTASKSFEIRVEIMTTELYEILEDLLNDSNENDSSFPVIIEGDFETINLTCKPRLQKSISRKSFFVERSFDIAIALETV